MQIKITGIGSLPYKNIKSALDFSFAHDIPFLPELPKVSKRELMLSSFLDSHQKLSTKGNEILEKGPLCYSLMMERLLDKKENISALKMQMVSPITVLLAQMKGGVLQKDLIVSTKKILEEKANFLFSGLNNFQGIIYFFLDCPSFFLLEKYDKSFKKSLWKSLRDICHYLKKDQRVKLGFHSCGKSDFSLILKENIPFDCFSFDAGISGLDFIRWGKEDEFLQFYERGGFLAYGGLGESFKEKKLLNSSYFEERVLNHMKFLTSSCGLAYYSLMDVELTLSKLKSLRMMLSK